MAKEENKIDDLDLSRKDKIPLTVLTGFLGSGKTTLLRYILESKEHKKRIAVIENEFATELGVKNELREEINQAACVAELYETSSGCLCCDGSEDFKRILKTLIQHKDRYDYILLETTGLVDPAFVQIFFLDSEISRSIYLDGVVTMVDSKHILSQLNRPVSKKQAEDPSRDVKLVLNEAYEQILLADKVILNKIDLVGEEEVAKVEETILAINPSLRNQLIRSSYAKVDLNEVIGIEAFDLEAHLDQDEGLLDSRPYRKHDVAISSVQMRGKGIYDKEDLIEFLDLFHKTFHSKVLRSKGIFHTASEKVIMQGVHGIYDVERIKVEEDDDANRLVAIGVDIDPVDMIQLYENHFSAGPEMRVDAQQYMDEHRQVGENIAPFGTVIIFLLVLIASSGTLTLSSWSGVGVVVALVAVLAVWVGYVVAKAPA